MRQLIEALTIFSKYTDDEYVTHCEHDILYVCVDPELVSTEDKEKLEELGFEPDDDITEAFSSYKYGSC